MYAYIWQVTKFNVVDQKVHTTSNINGEQESK